MAMFLALFCILFSAVACNSHGLGGLGQGAGFGMSLNQVGFNGIAGFPPSEEAEVPAVGVIIHHHFHHDGGPSADDHPPVFDQTRGFNGGISPAARIVPSDGMGSYGIHGGGYENTRSATRWVNRQNNYIPPRRQYATAGGGGYQAGTQAYPNYQQSNNGMAVGSNQQHNGGGQAGLNGGYNSGSAGYQNGGYNSGSTGYQIGGYNSGFAGNQNGGYNSGSAGYQNGGYNSGSTGYQNGYASY